jgi:hypothetical protein
LPYDTVWKKAKHPSNQVGHFLSAVSLAYDWPDAITFWFAIAHEIRSDNGNDPNGGMINQLNPTAVTKQMGEDFVNAIIADEQGNSIVRDNLLWGILGFPQTVDFGNVLRERQGNSIQDLRLAIRGFRFGKWVKNNQKLPSSEGANWLRKNIMVDFGNSLWH